MRLEMTLMCMDFVQIGLMLESSDHMIVPDDN